MEATKKDALVCQFTAVVDHVGGGQNPVAYLRWFNDCYYVSGFRAWEGAKMGDTVRVAVFLGPAELVPVESTKEVSGVK